VNKVKKQKKPNKSNPYKLTREELEAIKEFEKAVGPGKRDAIKKLKK